jgi:hypothetical protein
MDIDDLASSFNDKFNPHETRGTGSGEQSSLSNMAVPGGGPLQLENATSQPPPGSGPTQQVTYPTLPSTKDDGSLFVGGAPTQSGSSASDNQQKRFTKEQENAAKRIMDLEDDKWYDILNAPDNCTTEQAHKQYKALCLLVHPDHNGHPDAGAAFISGYWSFQVIASTDML